MYIDSLTTNSHLLIRSTLHQWMEIQVQYWGKWMPVIGAEGWRRGLSALVFVNLQFICALHEVTGVEREREMERLN
jgi:hypothetical protein